jgi:beta-lactamase class A
VKRNAFLAGLGAAALPLKARAATAYDRVHAIARDVPGVIGVFCRRLESPEPVFEYNPGETFPAASTIKVLIMATAYAMEERYPGTLDRTIVTHRSDLISGSDFMSQQPDGARFTVRELIVPMITLSDNTASNYLIAFFDFTTLAAMARRAGLEATHLKRHFMDFAAIVHHNDNTTTPRDMAKLLAEIGNGARGGEPNPIATPEHCSEMLRIMLRQTDREGIPAGLPRGTPVANKTGVLDGVRNDVAVVEPFGNAPYVLTVYTKWLTHAEPAYEAMRKAAGLSFDLLEG